jgi:hypothetical protein
MGHRSVVVQARIMHPLLQVGLVIFHGRSIPRMVKKLKLQERRAVIPSRRSRTAYRPLRFLGRSMAPIADRRAKLGTYGVTEANPD